MNEQDMLFSQALVWRFETLGGKTGWQLLDGDDADLLALLALAGEQEGGMDQIMAEVIATDRRAKVVIEKARVKNTKPLGG